MDYQGLKGIASTGDVLLVRKSTWVRLLTAESFSHVAILVWEGNHGGLWVYEFVEGTGYRSTPASAWIDQYAGCDLWLGMAPEIVRMNGETVRTAAHSYRDKRKIFQRYGWLSLIKVWLSQWLKIRIRVFQRVCSTFVQELWEAAGYTGFSQTEDPGNIANACCHLIKINADMGEK